MTATAPTLANKSWWYVRDGIIYFSVTSPRRKGAGWIKHFTKKGVFLNEPIKKSLLDYWDFKPSARTINVAIIKPSVIRGRKLSSEYYQIIDERPDLSLSEFSIDNLFKQPISSSIYEVAEEHNLIEPKLELGCLLRDLLTREMLEHMGLSDIVVFHDPISARGGFDSLRCTMGSSNKDGSSYLALTIDPSLMDGVLEAWPNCYSFAFEAPRPSA